MKKLIILLAGLAFCGGCHLPYPAVGVRAPQIETWEKICTVEKNPLPEKISTKTHCRWVRTR
jgi:hypothetical protein